MRESTKRDLEKHFSTEISIQKSHRGGNSIVHKVKLINTLLAVKEYSGNVERITRSIRKESSALGFLKDHEVLSVPKILYHQENLGFIVMEYIEGERPKPNRQSIEAMLEFIEGLHHLFLKDSSFGFAVDAGISLEELQNQIRERISQAKEESKEFIPKVEYVLNQLIKDRHNNDLQHQFTYSVSDLGLHNSLMREGKYHYFDLEFFGKDSPYKMVGDFLLHPQNQFSKEDNEFFLERNLTLFDLDRNQLGFMIGYLATKWSLICMKRLQNLKDSKGTSEVIQSQSKLVRYYLHMAEIFSQRSELDLLFDKDSFLS